MTRVLVVHRVADFAAWKVVFDAAAGIRSAGGERSYEVLREVGDPDVVVHLATWTSAEDARTFFESPALVALRAEAGVHAPTFTYLDSVEEGVSGS